MTGRMIEAIEGVLEKEKPDRLLVYGDTNSTLAGALAAAKLGVEVAHVEAGLRSFNRTMPEEINRLLTDHVCGLLFAPTDAAIENLRREGIAAGVHRTGDVMYDAALQFMKIAGERSDVMQRLSLKPRGYVLATVHRAENTDDPVRLANIFQALGTLAAEIAVVVPLHPRTRKMLAERGFVATPALRIVEPAGFLDMLVLEKNARLIVTDSGGVQKEAYFYGVPCVTLRQETEWVELVAAGANRLVAPLSVSAVLDALRMELTRAAPTPVQGLYGDGSASVRIAEILGSAAH
jgi:UDP-GlcNAc3NAcA epimerase